MGAGFNDRLAVQERNLVFQPFILPGGQRTYRDVVGSSGTSGVGSLAFYSASIAANGNAVEVDFVGSRIGLIASKGPDHGILDIYLDSTLVQAGIDLYASISQYAQTVFWRDGLSDGLHTLKVVVNGKNASSTGYYVYLDGILRDGPGYEAAKYTPVNVVNSNVSSFTVGRNYSSNGTGFWNNAAVSAGGTSTVVSSLGSQMRIVVNSSAATDITVQHSPNNASWYDGETISFTAAGTKTLVVDCCAYVRLKSSQAATITAGYIYLRG